MRIDPDDDAPSLADRLFGPDWREPSPGEETMSGIDDSLEEWGEWPDYYDRCP